MIHVYALTLERCDVTQLRGLDDVPVHFVDCGALQAVASTHERRPARDDDSTLRHAAVVAAVGAVVPALPVRYGSVHTDGEALRTRVAGATPALRSALERVAGCVEFVLRAVPATPPPATDDEQEAGPGRSYLNARLARQQAERAALDEARQRLAVPAAALEPVAVESVESDGRRGPETAFLVPAHRAEQFHAAAETAIRDDPAVVLGGPWPPFTFVSDV